MRNRVRWYIKRVISIAQGWNVCKLLKPWTFLFYLYIIIMFYRLILKKEKQPTSSWSRRNVALGNKVLSPMGWKRTWLSFAALPVYKWEWKTPGCHPAPPGYCNREVYKANFVNWKFVIVFLLLLKILISVVENWKSEKEFPCFLQHIFAQYPINLLTFFLQCFFFLLVIFFLFLKNVFKNVRSFVYCVKVLQVCFDGISSTSQHANIFFFLKK